MCLACKYDVCMIQGWVGDVCFPASWHPLTKSLRPWFLGGCKEPPLPLTIDLEEKAIIKSQSRHLSVPNVFDFALWGRPNGGISKGFQLVVGFLTTT